MRTSEERARLIHRRTAEIKQEHRKKNLYGRDGARNEAEYGFYGQHSRGA